MNRSAARPRLRALVTAALVAGTALGGVVVASPAATAADGVPDYLVGSFYGENLVRVTSSGQSSTPFADAGDSVRQVDRAQNGDVYIAAISRVLRIPATAPTTVEEFATGFSGAQGVAVHGDTVYVADTSEDRVYVYMPGQQRTEIATSRPFGIATEADGDLLVGVGPDFTNYALDRITPAGERTTLATGLGYISDIAVAPDGSILVAEDYPASQGAVKRIPAAGGAASLVGTTGIFATGVDVDAAGEVYATAFEDGAVYRWKDDGGARETVTTGLDSPTGLDLDQPPTTPQEIAFTSTAPTTAVVDGTSYSPTATGGTSGRPVTYSAGPADVCTYDDESGEVSFVGAGDCTVAADQAGGTAGGITYAPAATKTQTFAVDKGAQTITFAADTPTTGEVGDSFSPSATGGASGNPVTFTASGACGQPSSDNASTVFFLRRGTCLVTAEQAGNDDYVAAPSTQASVAVEVAPTTVDLEVTDEGMTATVTGPDSGPAPTGDVTFNLDQGPTRQPLGAVTLTPVDGEPTLASATLPASADPGTSGRIQASYAGLEDEDGVYLGGSEDSYSRTAPTITVAVTSREPANEAGWYRTRATVDFTCTAGSAELVTDCPVRISRANSRPDFAAIGLVTAADGGTGTATVPLQVDTRGPVLDVRRVGRAPYSRTARPVRCTAVDGRSGVDGSCTVTYGRIVAGPNGGARRTWTATATDVAGNTTTRSNGFTVTGAAPRPTRSPGR